MKYPYMLAALGAIAFYCLGLYLFGFILTNVIWAALIAVWYYGGPRVRRGDEDIRF